jgi:hypothetical protein
MACRRLRGMIVEFRRAFGGRRMLQWKPRLLLTLLVVALLLAIAFVSGYSEFVANFLEW